MPYTKVHHGSEICVYKEVGGKPHGDPLGCHATEQEADAQMAALYANADGRSAGDGYCALAKIDNHDDIIRVQDTLRTMLSGVEGTYLTPSEFHITLVYASGGDAERLRQSWSALEMAFSVLVDGIGVFDTPDGYAVHLTVRPVGSIIDVQGGLWIAFTEAGFDISPYSEPGNYKPHITLAYIPVAPVVPIPITPFALVVNSIELCDPAQKPIAISHMRSAPDRHSDARFINPTALRAIYHEVQGELEGYLAVWGSPTQRDAYDTWFDAKHPPDLGLKGGQFLPIRLMYEHGQDGGVAKEIVGEIYEVGLDGNGIRFRARLDRGSPCFDKAVQELRNHELGMSTASAPHLADFDSEGRFVNWYLSEASLTKTPAEARMPAVTLVRSNQSISASELLDARGALRAPGSGSDGASNSFGSEKGNSKMGLTLEQLGVAPTASLEDVLKALTDAVGPEAAAAMLQAMLGGAPSADDAPAQDTTMSAPPEERSAPTPAPTNNNDIVALRADLAALRAQMTQRMTAPAPESQVGRGDRRTPQISVSEPRKFWGRSLADLMLVYEVARSRNMRIGEDFMQVLGGRAATALEKSDPLMTNPVVRSCLPATRANEIVTSTASSGGDEWIGVAYSETLWEKARNNRIYQQLVAKGMRVEEVAEGKESVVIFTEGSDPTVYTISQSADLDATGRPTVVVPVTRPTTGNVTLTPGYLGMAIAYTSVFAEDSMIAAAPQLNKQMQEKAEETIEQLFLNGDTATTLNVNYDGGSTSGNEYYIASNGARKYAIVTGSGTKRDGGALDEEDYRLTLRLFPSAIRSRKQNIAFVIESDTYNTTLSISAIKTQDVFTMATIVDGELRKIWGVDAYESGFIPLTDTDGKVTYNAAGTKGTILGVYAPFWAMGWKRRVTIETDKDILAQSNLIVATFRLGFLPRGAGAAVATYNLTIA